MSETENSQHDAKNLLAAVIYSFMREKKMDGHLKLRQKTMKKRLIKHTKHMGHKLKICITVSYNGW